MSKLKVGDKSIDITPSNWVQLEGGIYTPKELRIIANEVEQNYDRINGNKNGHINKLE